MSLRRSYCPQLGECEEVSGFMNRGQEETTAFQNISEAGCKLLRNCRNRQGRHCNVVHSVMQNACSSAGSDRASLTGARKKPEPESPGCPVDWLPGLNLRRLRGASEAGAARRNPERSEGSQRPATHSFSAAPPDLAAAPGCSTSACRSVGPRREESRPRTDLPPVRELLPAGFVLHP